MFGFGKKEKKVKNYRTTDKEIIEEIHEFAIQVNNQFEKDIKESVILDIGKSLYDIVRYKEIHENTTWKVSSINASDDSLCVRFSIILYGKKILRKTYWHLKGEPLKSRTFNDYYIDLLSLILGKQLDLPNCVEYIESCDGFYKVVYICEEHNIERSFKFKIGQYDDINTIDKLIKKYIK